MGGLFAPKAKAPATERLSGIQVQSSVYGKPIPRVWGTARVAPNLIWYGAFTPISNVTKTKTGGKGGGGTQKTTTYSYKAALMMAVAAGPIVGIRTVYKDKAVFTDGGSSALQQVGLSLATGAIGQAPWGYLTTSFPSQALGYSGLAYVYSSSYELSDSGSITNHSFEVVSNTRISGKDDAEPADVITDVVNSIPLWQSGLLASLTNYRNYCLANGIWISPVLDSKVSAAQFLGDILDVTNSDVVWSGGQFKIVPRGDTAITANGATFTPDLAPIYDLDDSDYLRNGSDDPINYSLSRDADAYNHVSIEYLDRARGYVQAVVPGIDSAAVAEFGLRKKDTEQRPMICEAAVAAKVAQLKVAESSLVRRRFEFTLPDTYFLLEPTDYITVTEAGLSLDRVLCRVLTVNEADNGDIEIEAEEVLTGAAAAAQVTRQPMGGYAPGYDAAPGNAQTPVVISPPLQLVEGSLEMWVASSGGADWGGAEIWVSLDNTTYENTGRLEGPCRFGVTTTALASASDPHVAGTVGVNIAAAGGTLDSATQAEVDSAVTLCLIGNEVIAYRDATLTGTGLYTLGYLRRGLFGTTPQAWPAGTRFVRLDGAIASLPYKKEDLGKTVYIKLRSFNVYNRAYQDLASVTAYSLTLNTLGSLYLNTTVMPSTVGPGSVRVGRDIYPFGTGTTALPGTELLNSQITVDVNGRLTNTGTGLVVVDNSKISLSSLGYTGPTNPTRNVVATGLLANRPTGSDGDFYYATDDNNGAGLLYSKIAGAWVADPKAKVLFDSLTTTVNGNEAVNSAFRSAQASDNAAQAARLTTLDVAYRFPMPPAINKNSNFAVWSGASGTYPEDWVDWANGSANTKETGSLSPFAFRMNVAANTANQGIQQIMSGKMALGWHVLECEVTLNSGSLEGAAVHLNWGVSTVTNSDDIRLFTDPDITGAVIGAGTAGRRYRFSKLINITVVPNISVLYCMSAWSGMIALSPAKDLTWHKVLVRQASQGEIDAKVAKDTTIPSLTSRVATEESTRASADAALATRATTLEAKASANQQADFLLNGQFLRGTANWVASGGVTVNPQTPEGVTGRNGVNLTLTAGSGVQYYESQFAWPTWRGIDLAWVGITTLWNGGTNTGAAIRVFLQGRVGAGSWTTISNTSAITDIDQLSTPKTLRGTAAAGYDSLRLLFELTPPSSGSTLAFILTQRVSNWTGEFPDLPMGPRAVIGTEARIAVEESVRASADSALAVRASTLEAKTGPQNVNNLLANSNFGGQGITAGNSLDNWTVFGSTGYVTSSIFEAQPFVQIGGATAVRGLYQDVRVPSEFAVGTDYYSLACLARNTGSGVYRLYLQWLDETRTISYGYSDVLQSSSTVWEYKKLDAIAQSGMVKPGAAKWIRVHFDNNGGTIAAGNIQQATNFILTRTPYAMPWTATGEIANMYSAIRIEESARASADSAQASQITTLTARSFVRGNLVKGSRPYLDTVSPNSLFSRFSWVSQGLWNVGYSAYVDGPYLSQSLTSASGYTWNAMVTNAIPVAQGVPISAQAMLGKFGTWSTGTIRLVVYWYSDLAGLNVVSQAGNKTFEAGVVVAGQTAGTGARWVDLPNLVAPAGIQSFRVGVWTDNATGNGVYTEGAAWMLKAEYGSTCTAWTDDALPIELDARITTVNSVAVDGRGRAYAVSGTQSEVNGRKGGFVFDNNGLMVNFQITADDFRIYQQVGGTYIVPFRVVGGQTQIDDALIRNLNVIPNGGGPSHRVQLRPNSVSGADGASFTFSTPYGGIPLVRAVITTPPALGSGETFEVVPVSLSASGFTIRAKKFTPGTPAAQSSGAGSNVGGTPQWQAQKPTTTDADGGAYTFAWSATLARVSNEFMGGNQYYAEYQGDYDVYYNAGSGWVFAYTASLFFASFYTGSSPTTVSISGSSTAYLPAIGQHGGAEFGLHPTLGSITAFAGVSYTITSQSSVVTLPGNFTFEIFPPT